MLRPAAVSGLFYPAEPEVLAQTVATLLDAADHARGTPPGPEGRQPGGVPIRRPKALIVPHAGYAYSGPVAASAYALLRATLALGPPIRRVVLLGPAHRLYCRGLADACVEFFETPLGVQSVDRAVLADLPGRTDGRRAHEPEHSLEVQLPFVRTLLPDATLVPLLCCDTPPEIVAAGLEALWGGDETLVLFSTDLSHFLPPADAREMDTATADHIASRGTPSLTGHQACGAAAVNGLLDFAATRPLTFELLDLRNSADTAPGAGRRGDGVVGYGAFAIYDARTETE